MSGRLFTVGDIHGCAAELEALLRGLPIEAGDTVAFAVALMRCIYVKDGATHDLDFRLTIGLRKIAGRWMFVHEHHSVPATD